MLKSFILSITFLLSIALPTRASLQIDIPARNAIENSDDQTYRDRVDYLQNLLQPPFISNKSFTELGIDACTLKHPQVKTALLKAIEDKQPKANHPKRYYLLGILTQREGQKIYEHYLAVLFPNGDCASIQPHAGLEQFIPGKQQAIQFELSADLWDIKDLIIPADIETTYDPNEAHELGHGCDPTTQTTFEVYKLMWGPTSNIPCGLRNQRLPLVWDRLPKEMRITPQGRSRR